MLVADVRAARVGIQEYLRSETDAPATFTGDRVRVYRPEEEVFNRDSMASYAATTVTIDHPSTPVDSTNWDKLGVGEVNGDVIRDGGFVRVPVIVRDAAAVEKVRTTHKQLSAGYSCTLDWTPGTTASGDAYDAVQRNIRLNHIAAVPAARGGPELRVVDERPSLTNDRKDGTMPHTLIVDGLQVPNVSDEAKACIEKLQGALKDEQTARAADKTAHDKAIATKDATIDDLKTKAVDQAKIDALADAKAAVVADAKKVAGDKLGDTAGKTVPEVRRMAVAARLGDAAVADKSDDYIEARFDTLKDGSSTNDRTVVNINPASQVANDSGAAVRNLARASQF
jgi:hypothetical protein